MKIVLWASLSANGSYLRATSDAPPDPKVLEDVYTRVRAAGSVVFGRVTYDELTSRGENLAALEADVIVVSRKRDPREGVLLADSPKAAMEKLRSRNHETVLVCGGAALLNAFLEEDVVDELIFNYTPHLSGSDLHVNLAKQNAKALSLLSCEELGNGIMQMRYSLRDK